MVHEELSCKGPIIVYGEHSPGLHFMLMNSESGRVYDLNWLKEPVQVYGSVCFGSTILKEKVTIEEGMYLIIALHGINDVPFDPESHDFLTYLRSYFMGCLSKKVTAKIVSFRKALPLAGI